MLSVSEVSQAFYNIFESRYEVANKKSQLTLELVNSINVNGDPFSPNMERYLMSACDIVFTIKENATFKDIIGETL